MEKGIVVGIFVTKILYKLDKKKILFILLSPYILKGLLINSVVGLNLNLNISSDNKFAILFVLGLLKFKPLETGLNNEISKIGFGREYKFKFSIIGKI